MTPSLSVVIPTYRREKVLLDTLGRVTALLHPDDEVVVIDQTPQHTPEVEAALDRLSASGVIRWYRRARPHICEAMNLGALLARGDLLLFLDDDVVPQPGLIEAHRGALTAPDPPPATCGQVLQPWDSGAVAHVNDFGEGFNAAYDQPCDVLSLIGCNFGIRKETFLVVGGLDENFFGVAYRWEAEFTYRLYRRTGRKVRFLPEASLRHLRSGSGGTRAFGAKDAWRHISGSVGDYYFAIRSLPPLQAAAHCLRRLFRAPVNRNTVRRPWLIPSLLLREAVALAWAAAQVHARPRSPLKSLEAYDPPPVPVGTVPEVLPTHPT